MLELRKKFQSSKNDAVDGGTPFRVIVTNKRVNKKKPYRWVTARTKQLQPSELLAPLSAVGNVVSEGVNLLPGGEYINDYVFPALSVGNWISGSGNPYIGAEIRANDERQLGAWLPLDLFGPKIVKGAVSKATPYIKNNIFWNNGKIIQKEIPYNSDHFYRRVGLEAIDDAEKSGLIRGNPFKKDSDPSRGPFFAYKRGNPTPSSRNIAVIEGTPESAESWIDSFRSGSRRKIIEEKINNPDVEGYPFWKELYDNPIRDIRKPFVESPEALKYMEQQKGNFILSEAGNEAFPFTNGSVEVPTQGFTYWKKYPLIGWRQHQFRQPANPQTPRSHYITNPASQ